MTEDFVEFMSDVVPVALLKLKTIVLYKGSLVVLEPS